MSLYNRYVLPHLIKTACSVGPIMKQREKVVPLAEGRVLEIGIGSGLNLPYYDKSKVSQVFGLDSASELLDDARESAQAQGIELALLNFGAERIPMEKNEVDTVLVTYSLCSIDALQPALAEMRRVLKPTGKLIFCEHGAAPDAHILRWQQRITPLWKHVAGGCRLDRNIPSEIEAGGFTLTSLEQMYLPRTLRIVGYNIWGTAKAV